MYSYPNEQGRFGDFGGKFVPETLMQPLEEIEKAFHKLKDDPSFKDEYKKLLFDYSGRPTALTFADQLTKQLGGAKIYLKREDLNHMAPIKSTMHSGRPCLLRKWGKRSSSLKQALTSTESPRQPLLQSSACHASFLWERKMLQDSR